MEQIRFAGTMAHAAVGHPTTEQIQRLHTLDYVKEVGTGNSVGVVQKYSRYGKYQFDPSLFRQDRMGRTAPPAYVDIVGTILKKKMRSWFLVECWNGWELIPHLLAWRYPHLLHR